MPVAQLFVTSLIKQHFIFSLG